MKRWRVLRENGRTGTRKREATSTPGKRTRLADVLGFVEASSQSHAITAAMREFRSMGLNASNIVVEEVTDLRD